MPLAWRMTDAGGKLVRGLHLTSLGVYVILDGDKPPKVGDMHDLRWSNRGREFDASAILIRGDMRKEGKLAVIPIADLGSVHIRAYANSTKAIRSDAEIVDDPVHSAFVSRVHYGFYEGSLTTGGGYVRVRRRDDQSDVTSVQVAFEGSNVDVGSTTPESAALVSASTRGTAYRWLIASDDALYVFDTVGHGFGTMVTEEDVVGIDAPAVTGEIVRIHPLAITAAGLVMTQVVTVERSSYLDEGGTEIQIRNVRIYAVTVDGGSAGSADLIASSIAMPVPPEDPDAEPTEYEYEVTGNPMTAAYVSSQGDIVPIYGPASIEGSVAITAATMVGDHLLTRDSRDFIDLDNVRQNVSGFVSYLYSGGQSAILHELRVPASVQVKLGI